MLWFLGNSEGFSGTEGFNFAKSDAVSSDLREQADELISKLKRTSNVDIDDDWKVLRERFYRKMTQSQITTKYSEITE